MRRLKDLEQFAGHPLLPTNVAGACSIPLLEPGFDPHGVGQRELRAHGFPWIRPDNDSHPQARAAWASVFGKGWTPAGQIVPQLAVGRAQPRATARRAAHGQEQFHNAWSGVVVQDAFDLGIDGNVSVSGQWSVPAVARPLDKRQMGPLVGTDGQRLPFLGWDSSTWIGIDGCGGDSTDVLQAGVQHYVTDTGAAIYLAWFEWFVAQALPDDPPYVFQTAITNFGVHPGDLLSCKVSYVNRQYGTVSLSNMSTGAWFSMALAPPSNASLDARSIEWILEAPGGGWPDGAIVPDFAPVTFANAFGCGGGAGDLVDPQGGVKLSLLEGSPSDPLVRTTVATDAPFTVTIAQA